ncbi:MAG: LacI family DNA-binding transcriptional regulator [Fusobacteriaceae bacterium]|uniref:LacI family DNA-binding transcriptional regulator n=1 Tax=Cetobacterium sp. TaxID=2071632 RepID=UPI003F2D7A7D
MKPSIKEIAKKLNVAPSTVSRALNDKHDISQTLKDKVNTIAKEIGYKKNSIAARLVNQKSNTIGLFFLSRQNINNEENTGFKYVEIILDKIKDKNYDLIIFSIDSNLKDKKKYIDICSERQVEGAIFIGLEDTDENTELLRNIDIPTVILEKRVSGKNISYIGSDNEYGINSILDYLLELGHENIGFIKGPDFIECSKDRFNTFYKRMNSLNLYKEKFVKSGNFRLESGYESTKDLLNSKDIPTAIIASSDLMAIGAMKAIKEKGLKIPEDISLVGYDGFDIGSFLSPSLTTVLQDFKSMGEKAVEILFSMIVNKEKSINMVFKPKLIKRESTK